MFGRAASALTLVTPTGVIPASECDRLDQTKSVWITLNVLAWRGKRGVEEMAGSTLYDALQMNQSFHSTLLYSCRPLWNE